VALGAIAGVLALGQTSVEAPAFEVASVKRAVADPKVASCLCEPMGRVAYRGAPLEWIVERAYRMQNPQIAGPAWLDTESFDVDAKLPEGASAEQVPAMLQELLAKRFQFATHTEVRELQAFTLTIGKGGSKLVPPEDGWASGWRQTKTGIHLRQKMSMDELAYYLSTQVERPVVN
jgi:uncharacterized protein (TIGR03435 family)